MRSINIARNIALKNGENYHVAAILLRDGIPIRIGTNQSKTHPIAYRRYKDGQEAANMHAEMDVLRFARKGDSLVVTRFLKDGSLTMAKPCIHCIKLIKSIGLKEVRYTNWSGNWEYLCQ